MRRCIPAEAPLRALTSPASLRGGAAASLPLAALASWIMQTAGGGNWAGRAAAPLHRSAAPLRCTAPPYASAASVVWPASPAPRPLDAPIPLAAPCRIRLFMTETAGTLAASSGAAAPSRQHAHRSHCVTLSRRAAKHDAHTRPSWFRRRAAACDEGAGSVTMKRNEKKNKKKNGWSCKVKNKWAELRSARWRCGVARPPRV